MAIKKDSVKKTSDISRKRSIAKYGMAVSMGLLVTTGLMDTKRSKAMHLVSGAGLIGFSVWHYSLYPTKKKKV